MGGIKHDVRMAYRPGQRAQRAHALQVKRPQGLQVGGDPELEDEEPPAYDAMRPDEQRDLQRRQLSAFSSSTLPFKTRCQWHFADGAEHHFLFLACRPAQKMHGIVPLHADLQKRLSWILDVHTTSTAVTCQ